ncbi:N-lysine methyltransferase KMT5A-like [Frankliniella occidentalis]|uniref:N-lysine methyltransferase KMT5A-like n=1 Tax=Frankliniella occidentalis TaxID=133901 RepID=A0A9C6U021_FRAOC|nr:N-lysine methyltransferase KMT5A-like [Frankliniella occidentalis]
MGRRKEKYATSSARRRSRHATAAKKLKRHRICRVTTRSMVPSAPKPTFQGDVSGLEMRVFNDKGRGVVATRHFPRGRLLLQYKGELLSKRQGLQREQDLPEESGSFLYFFPFKGKQYCIDASAETGDLGRLVNHSRSTPNVIPRALPGPIIVFEALRDIEPGQELLFDYGERRSEFLLKFPWLKN